VAQFTEDRARRGGWPQLDAMERNAAAIAQSLVSTFVESARDAYPDARPQSVTASVSLSRRCWMNFPFEHEDERAHLSIEIEQRLLCCLGAATCCTWCCAR
jgi:two-component system response regulator PhcR